MIRQEAFPLLSPTFLVYFTIKKNTSQMCKRVWVLCWLVQKPDLLESSKGGCSVFRAQCHRNRGGLLSSAWSPSALGFVSLTREGLDRHRCVKWWLKSTWQNTCSATQLPALGEWLLRLLRQGYFPCLDCPFAERFLQCSDSACGVQWSWRHSHFLLIPVSKTNIFCCPSDFHVPLPVS